jgi:hypothetical protein
MGRFNYLQNRRGHYHFRIAIPLPLIDRFTVDLDQIVVLVGPNTHHCL